ncbi:hepatitis A virus cellular receptor 1 homolog isoform X2 [Syngnathoides biaculeatus]|uniref:hepatitis A virus cellular receptor 1 homolog isoform X2 n=1 Tax=Syngnathoides biaculeatus TaxID=300417 RepID=UPI002ADDA840|nr:hepatitis A virus cellular receptor 1 homolog isoform X2 [Syngnathoides biaculeatus]
MRGLCYLFLSVLSQVGSEDVKVSGHVGRNVTLPCVYNTRDHGPLDFCWGRGKVPSFKCSNGIVFSKNGAVRFISGSRYQLLGRLGDGDVSLTILNAQPDDAGVYGCRVEVPGWFNDHKANAYLAVEEVPLEQPVTHVILAATTRRQQLIPDDVSVSKHAEEDHSTLINKGKAERSRKWATFADLQLLSPSLCS